MNAPITSTEIRDALGHTSRDLSKAREDHALYERLKAAAAEIRRLEKLGEDLTAELIAAEDREARQAKEALFAQFDGITVVAGDGKGSLLNTPFTILYKRLGYDSGCHRNVWTEQSKAGFQSLPDDAFAYLIERHPEVIPAGIMALAPGNPSEAFSRYFVAKRRGYLSAPAAA
jgi:hypothetical protein